MVNKKQKEQAVVVKENQTAVAAFGQLEPDQVVDKAKKVANTLAPIIDEQNLSARISGKQYVLTEGWTTLGAMLGAFPHCVDSERTEKDGEVVWEATITFKTANGQEVATGSALCSSEETIKTKKGDIIKRWYDDNGKPQEFAIKSMAQTRATGKAGRLGFAWIMKLAGYESTPAEEMNSYGNGGGYSGSSSSNKITSKQAELIFSLCKQLGATKKEESLAIIAEQADEVIESMDKVSKITKKKASKIIDKLLKSKGKKSEAEETKAEQAKAEQAENEEDIPVIEE